MRVCSTKDSTVSPGYHSSIGLSCRPRTKARPRDAPPQVGAHPSVHLPSGLGSTSNNLTDQVIAPLSVSTTVPSVTCRLPTTPHFLSTSFDPQSNGRRLFQIGPTPGPLARRGGPRSWPHPSWRRTDGDGWLCRQPSKHCWVGWFLRRFLGAYRKGGDGSGGSC